MKVATTTTFDRLFFEKKNLAHFLKWNPQFSSELSAILRDKNMISNKKMMFLEKNSISNEKILRLVLFSDPAQNSTFSDIENLKIAVERWKFEFWYILSWKSSY